MSKTTFTKLGLKPQKQTSQLKINEESIIEVKNYLSILDKIALVQYVVDNALDEYTGCFSPARVEIYFSIGICKYYTGISFTEKQLNQDIAKTYDLLEENHIIDMILSVIPEVELNFIQDLVKDTIADVARYNSSAAGIIQSMSSQANGLNDQLTKMLEEIKSGDGQQAITLLKDVVQSN